METCLHAECAGISVIEAAEKEQVLQLVDRILTNQPARAGPTQLIEHCMQLENSDPVRHADRWMSLEMCRTAHRIVDKWTEDGISEPSDSDCSSAPVLVRKSDGLYRMCVDYRDLNAHTRRDAYPSPSMETHLRRLTG